MYGWIRRKYGIMMLFSCPTASYPRDNDTDAAPRYSGGRCDTQRNGVDEITVREQVW